MEEVMQGYSIFDCLPDEPYDSTTDDDGVCGHRRPGRKPGDYVEAHDVQSAERTRAETLARFVRQHSVAAYVDDYGMIRAESVFTFTGDDGAVVGDSEWVTLEPRRSAVLDFLGY